MRYSLPRDHDPEPTDAEVSRRRNASKMDKAVVALAERTARFEAGQRADRTIKVTFVEPWSLSKRGRRAPKAPKFSPQPRRWS